MLGDRVDQTRHRGWEQGGRDGVFPYNIRPRRHQLTSVSMPSPTHCCATPAGVLVVRPDVSPVL
jgi:hypothetical protein